MIDDIFVFDCVVHAYDQSPENVKAGEEAASESILGFGGHARHPGNAHIEYARRWTPEDMYELVFAGGPTDMAMAQVVPIYDWFEDFWAPVAAQYELAARYPDRVLFCGGVDPAHQGLDVALAQMEHQVKELGAQSFKFYNGHVERSWRCDDRELAYPLYRKAAELGVRTLQFHKGIPFANQPLEPLTPLDLERPAREFPELNFVIHHLAYPYVDECLSIAGRHPNVYLALSGTISLLFVAPRMVQEHMGRLLGEVGVEKLFWGSEAALLGPPRPYIEEFLKLEIPEDLRAGYGYPQITREDKERILGRNFAVVMGIDVEAKKAELLADPAAA